MVRSGATPQGRSTGGAGGARRRASERSDTTTSSCCCTALRCRRCRSAAWGRGQGAGPCGAKLMERQAQHHSSQHVVQLQQEVACSFGGVTGWRSITWGGPVARTVPQTQLVARGTWRLARVGRNNTGGHRPDLTCPSILDAPILAGFGIAEHIDLGIKYDPSTGIFGARQDCWTRRRASGGTACGARSRGGSAAALLGPGRTAARLGPQCMLSSRTHTRSPPPPALRRHGLLRGAGAPRLPRGSPPRAKGARGRAAQGHQGGRHQVVRPRRGGGGTGTGGANRARSACSWPLARGIRPRGASSTGWQCERGS